MVLTRIGFTGASGMVGRHLIEILEEKQIYITASSLERPYNLPDNSLWTKWDLAQWKTLNEIDEIFPDIDAFIHIGAAINPELSNKQIFDANVRSCLNLSEWALKKKIPFIYISGAIVYADPNRINIQENDPTGFSGVGGFYGYSKYLAEQVLLPMVSTGLKLCILRPSSIYGFGLSDHKIVSSFLHSAALGHLIRLESPIEDRVDLIHARDVAGAIIQAIDNKSWGVFNISSEYPASIHELAKTCVEVVGRGGIEVVSRAGDRVPCTRYGLKCDAARHAFDYSPTLTLKQGLMKMWQDINKKKFGSLEKV